jgi:CheY-like chemotaxis protein
MSVLARALDLAEGGEVNVSIERRPESIRLVATGAAGGADDRPPPGRAGPDDEISEKMVEALGGTLSVERGEEAAWSLVLTLASARHPVALVIDNSPDFAELVARYLRPYRWETVGATGVEQAFASALELRPSVILLDVLMPDRDGWELLADLKANARTKDIPVHICSVLYEPQLAAALGAVGWIPKPVTRLSLLQALQPWRPDRRAEGTEN